MEDTAKPISESVDEKPLRFPIAVIFSAVGPFAGFVSLALASGIIALLNGTGSWDFHPTSRFGEFGKEIAGSLIGILVLLPLISMVGVIPACLTGLVAALVSKLVTRPAIYVGLCVVIGALVALACLLPMGSEWSQMGAVAGAGGGLACGFLTRHHGRRAQTQPSTTGED